MQQHIQIFNPDGLIPCGLVKICNIEEVWLNESSNSVAIRYRAPSGRLIDHEEYFDCNRLAKLRYSLIKHDILDNPHDSFEVGFRKSLKAKWAEMEVAK